MTEVRPNSVAVCNFHQQKIDSIDVKQVMKEFVANSDMRKSLFGQFCNAKATL